MILALFGYPKSGKTLIFNILSGTDEEISKFSASSTECHKATVNVPDQRLDQIADLCGLPPVRAKIEYLDTGAISFGEVKNATFLDLLRRADGLIHIVRGFEDDEIPHPLDSIDPERDIRTMDDELKSSDYVSIEKRLERLKADLQKMKSKELEEEFQLLEKLKGHLEAAKPLREFPFTERENHIVRGFQFLSQKPVFHIINSDENHYGNHLKMNRYPEKNSATGTYCAKIEQELLELAEDERSIFQEEYGLKDYDYIQETFVRASYQLMDLIAFFTVGKNEVRSWTIAKSDTALTAAGKIHKDIQQGFIRAEVICWKDFLDTGGFSKAKEKGLLRLEGKEYHIQDGEVIQFRFNK